VTIAVLLDTIQASDGCAAALPLHGATPLGRLIKQLDALGACTTVVTSPGCEGALRTVLLAHSRASLRTSCGVAEDLDVLADVLDGPGSGPVVLAAAETVVHDAVLRGMQADPRSGVTVLTGAPAHAASTDVAWPVRASAGVITAASSDFHRVSDADGAALGVLRVTEAHRAGVAATARRAAATMRGRDLVPLPRRGASRREAMPVGDALALLLVALVRDGMRVKTVPLRGFAWGRPRDATTAATAARRLVEVDEERARVDAAVKPDDGFFGTFFVSPYSKYLAKAAAKLGVSPNVVTVLSMVLGAVAAGLFALGDRAWLVVGAIVLHVAFTLDCVDGQLARYTGAFSALGAYLDAVFDRAKEYLVYAGLAIGAAGQGDDVWTLAAVALMLQTSHHTLQFSWPGGEQPRVAPRTGPLTEPEIRPCRPERTGAGERANGKAWARRMVAALSGRTASRPVVVWTKRMLPFPIGERFAVITLAAALGGPRVVFVVFIAWVSLALAWSTTGRVLRTVSR
jgi:hypothetical protein